jgi:Secretion system C-terminal sorting domain
MITQGKTRLSDPFVNESRYIFEYCGDAVATQEVKKELLSCLVFPNPASESLTVRLKDATISNADVSIVNTTGQVVFQERNKAIDTPLSIATLPNGLYILKVQSADKIGITSFTVLK